MMQLLIENGLHMQLIGPTGTAKTITTKDCLNTYYNNKDLGHLIINFSGQTKA
jgi:hypothetical protein